MNRLRFPLALIITLFSLIITASAVDQPVAKGPDALEIRAEAAILVEPASGAVLFEKNADARMYPASLTKIMTALIVIEHGGLDEVVTVSETSESDLDPDGSSVLPPIKTGEQMSVRDLLYCVLVSSDNRACNVLAEHVAGSVDKFVELMNKRASELKLKNTHFANAHGLHDENHYSSARDMYLIAAEAYKNQIFMEIASSETRKIPQTNLTAEERHIKTTNYLTSKLKNPNYIYYPARGIKTGHTSHAGYCLVSSADSKDMNLISVVMKSSIDDSTKLIGSFTDTRDMFQWGFKNFTHKTLVKSGEEITEIKVELASDNNHVVLKTDSGIDAIVSVDFDVTTLEKTIELYNKDGVVEAPIEKGQQLGSVTYTKDGKEYGKLNLIAANSVARSQFLYFAKVILDFISQPWFIWTIVIAVLLFIAYIVLVIRLNINRRREKERKNYKGRRNRR